jgi:hydrogenase-4 membrane subunit HyfE
MLLMKQIQTEVISNVLGTLSISDYISAFIFASLGLIVRHYLIVKKSLKKNPKTPNNFDPKYWFKNNFFTKLSGILIIYIIIYLCLRFSVEWFGIKVTMTFAFTLGVGFDYVLDIIKKKQNSL